MVLILRCIETTEAHHGHHVIFTYLLDLCFNLLSTYCLVVSLTIFLSGIIFRKIMTSFICISFWIASSLRWLFDLFVSSSAPLFLLECNHLLATHRLGHNSRSTVPFLTGMTWPTTTISIVVIVMLSSSITFLRWAGSRAISPFIVLVSLSSLAVIIIITFLFYLPTITVLLFRTPMVVRSRWDRFSFASPPITPTAFISLFVITAHFQTFIFIL